MRDAYPRLFEPAYLEPGVPNPRHPPLAAYRDLAPGGSQAGGPQHRIPSHASGGGYGGRSPTAGVAVGSATGGGDPAGRAAAVPSSSLVGRTVAG